MNEKEKQEIAELAATLNGILEKNRWDSWEVFKDGKWQNSPFIPMAEVRAGNKIRLKPEPEPDPYAELKAASDAGKVIEENITGTFRCGADQPAYWQEKTDGDWSMPPDRYRIKPDPVPLAPEDVPPGSVLRLDEWNRGQHVTPSVFLGVVCWINTTGPVYLTYDELMRGGWLILRPGQDWQPCHKDAP